MTTQRRTPFWQLPEVLKELPEAQIREESIGADTVLLHVTYPRDTDVERVTNFARMLGREIPKNVRAVLTEDDIKISVHRPRIVSLNINGNTIRADTLLDQIKEIVGDPEVNQIHLSITNNIIEAPPVEQASALVGPTTSAVSHGKRSAAGERSKPKVSASPKRRKSLSLVEEK